MKSLVVGDIHANKKNVNEINKLSSELVRLLKEKSPDIMVFLGDIFHEFDRVNLCALMAVRNLLSKCSRRVKKIYVLAGNHDMINNQIFCDPYYNFVETLKDDNVIPVSDIEFIMNGSEHIATCIPYVAPGRFAEALRTDSINYLENEAFWNDNKDLSCNPKVIFCHQEFKGSRLGVQLSRNGDDYKSDKTLIISGHIHEKGWLNDKTYYVGTPFQTTFDEKDDKSVILLDFDNLTLEELFLDIPKLITLDMSCSECLGWSAPDISSKYRIRIQDKKENIVVFKNSDNFKDLSRHFKFLFTQTDTVKERRNKDNKGFIEIFRSLVEKEDKETQYILDVIHKEISSAAIA